MRSIIVSPSILSADFCNMERDIRMTENASADWIHCDVMDGVFVPNISFGQKMVGDINRITDMFLDVHLMITEPIRYIDEFADKGADMITFHIEATDKVEETIRAIKNREVKCGISVKPGTPVNAVFPYIDKVDMVLVMSVEPGFSGQKFMPIALSKLSELRRLNDKIILQVDGGINEKTAIEVIKSGADSLVMGNAFYKAENPAAVVRTVKSLG